MLSAPRTVRSPRRTVARTAAKTARSPPRFSKSLALLSVPIPSDSNESDFKRQAEGIINELIRTAPSTWKSLFKSLGLSDTPTILELIDTALEKTAGGNDPGPKGSNVSGIPMPVRKEALKGVILSHEANYPSYNGIGLVRGMQLATQDRLPEREVKRMCAFFSRNRRYMDYSCFGNDDEKCKSWLAWLNWGGSDGREWSCATK